MKALMKTFTWRFVATSTTGLLAYVFTGAFDIAASIAGAEAIAKMILYYLHEKIWDRYKPDKGAHI